MIYAGGAGVDFDICAAHLESRTVSQEGFGYYISLRGFKNGF